jgi:hypothetical protein
MTIEARAGETPARLATSANVTRRGVCGRASGIGHLPPRFVDPESLERFNARPSALQSFLLERFKMS